MGRTNVNWNNTIKSILVDTLRENGLLIIGDPHGYPDAFIVATELINELDRNSEGKFLILELEKSWNESSSKFQEKYQEHRETGPHCTLDKESSLACVDAAIQKSWEVRGCEDFSKLQDMQYAGSHGRQGEIADMAKGFLNASSGGIMIYGKDHVTGKQRIPNWRSLTRILTGDEGDDSRIQQYLVKMEAGKPVPVDCVPRAMFQQVQNVNPLKH